MSPPARDEPNDDAGRAAKAAAILGGILALGALSIYGTRAAFSVLVGATIAVANLLTMRAIIRALVKVPPDVASSTSTKGTAGGEEGTAGNDPDGANAPNDAAGRPAQEGTSSTQPPQTGGKAGIAWGVFAAFKMLLLFGGVWVLLTRQVVDPMALLVGYGVLPLGITAGAVWSSLTDRD